MKYSIIWKESRVEMARNLLIGLMIFLLLTSSGCQKKNNPVPEKTKTPEVKIKKLDMVAKVEGEVQWKLIADEAEISDTDKKAVVRKVICTFYDKGKPALVVESPSAAFDMNTKNIELKEDVKAKDFKGNTLSADILRWDSKTKKIVGTGNVVLAKGKNNIKGDKIVTDVLLKNAKVTGKVMIHYFEKPKTKKPPEKKTEKPKTEKTKAGK